jgi:hypothetical protein
MEWPRWGEGEGNDLPKRYYSHAERLETSKEEDAEELGVTLTVYSCWASTIASVDKTTERVPELIRRGRDKYERAERVSEFGSALRLEYLRTV